MILNDILIVIILLFVSGTVFSNEIPKEFQGDYNEGTPESDLFQISRNKVHYQGFEVGCIYQLSSIKRMDQNTITAQAKVTCTDINNALLEPPYNTKIILKKVNKNTLKFTGRGFAAKIKK